MFTRIQLLFVQKNLSPLTRSADKTNFVFYEKIDSVDQQPNGRKAFFLFLYVEELVKSHSNHPSAILIVRFLKTAILNFVDSCESFAI